MGGFGLTWSWIWLGVYSRCFTTSWNNFYLSLVAHAWSCTCSVCLPVCWKFEPLFQVKLLLLNYYLYHLYSLGLQLKLIPADTQTCSHSQLNRVSSHCPYAFFLTVVINWSMWRKPVCKKSMKSLNRKNLGSIFQFEGHSSVILLLNLTAKNLICHEAAAAACSNTTTVFCRSWKSGREIQHEAVKGGGWEEKKALMLGMISSSI